jgi:hypothetical protein
MSLAPADEFKSMPAVSALVLASGHLRTDDDDQPSGGS